MVPAFDNAPYHHKPAAGNVGAVALGKSKPKGLGGGPALVTMCDARSILKRESTRNWVRVAFSRSIFSRGPTSSDLLCKKWG